MNSSSFYRARNLIHSHAELRNGVDQDWEIEFARRAYGRLLVFKNEVGTWMSEKGRQTNCALDQKRRNGLLNGGQLRSESRGRQFKPTSGSSFFLHEALATLPRLGLELTEPVSESGKAMALRARTGLKFFDDSSRHLEDQLDYFRSALSLISSRDSWAEKTQSRDLGGGDDSFARLDGFR